MNLGNIKQHDAASLVTSNLVKSSQIEAEKATGISTLTLFCWFIKEVTCCPAPLCVSYAVQEGLECLIFLLYLSRARITSRCHHTQLCISTLNKPEIIDKIYEKYIFTFLN